jgi:hypothetical protein
LDVSQERSRFFDGFVAIYVVFAVVRFVSVLNRKNSIVFQVRKFTQILTVVAKYFDQGANVVGFRIDKSSDGDPCL